MVQRLANFLFISLLPTILVGSAQAQSLLYEEIEVPIPKVDSTFYLDNWLDKHSILVQTLPDSFVVETWSYNSESGFISVPKLDSNIVRNQKALTIYYGRIPTSLNRVYQQHQVVEFHAAIINQDSNTVNITNTQNRHSSDIQQSGSLSRGIIVGSNQDFALESGLQFQLSGQLTDDILLDAVLTDQSIPFQPDGTTQSIREFDKVLIRLQSEQAKLEMGDVDVSLSNTTFGTLNRRLQGAAGSFENETNQSKIAVSSVRGSYTTQQFKGIEGVRGPYRLTGRNNQPFVIILAGTEQVYINGQLVNRGEENEYIIDYGLGEIYFTDQVFVKDETRIFVEYEYVDQEFSRTLIAGEATQKLWDNRLKIGVSVIRMADGNDLLSQQSLSADDINVLESVGDNIQNAIVSGIVENADEDAFNVRYALVDTVYQGATYQIFKNVPGTPTSNLAVRFSNVGEGNGAYVRVGNAINGLLYEWRGPAQGSYEPFRNLPAPERHQMVSITAGHQINKHVRYFGELALSDLDRNRFSSLGDSDNTDAAFHGGFEATNLEVGATVFDVNYQHRQSGANFESFERTRNVEFDRLWNINQNEVTGEKLDEISVGALINKNVDVTIGAGRLSLPELNSWRQSADVDADFFKKTSISYQQEYSTTTTNQISQENTWLKQRASVQTPLTTRLSSYMRFEQENKSNQGLNKQLESTSFRFFEVAPGVEYQLASGKVSVGLAYRNEDGALEGNYINEYKAVEQHYGIEWLIGDIFSTKNKVKFRNKRLSEEMLEQGGGNSNALLINSVNQLETERLSIRSRYNVSTQREAISQETYYEVGPELGQFVWIDGNENGVEEIDEFFPELSPNEGTYVLQYLPSDELVPTTELTFRNGFDWKPFASNDEDKKSSKLLESIEMESRFDILENTTNSNEKEIYLINLDTFRDENLTIRGRLSWSQRVKIHPTENWQSSVLFNSSRTLNKRTTEVVRTYNENIIAENEYQINSGQSASLTLSASIKKSESSELTQRSFNIKSFLIEPAYRYRMSRSFQVGLRGGLTSKTNRIETQDDTIAEIYKVIITTRAFFWDKIQFGNSLEFRNSTLTGETNTYTNFELTEGTGKGKHLIWSTNASYRINNLVRITFNYDGRTVSGRSDIHTIKLVVSAIF